MTTISTDHAGVVADIYAAFGTGDVPRILAHLDPDVLWDADWQDNFAQRAGVAVLTPRKGRDDVAGFFAYLAGCSFESFAVLDVLAGERQVVAQVEIEFVMPSGGRHRDQELHLWTFGPDGKVVAFRHYGDTAKIIAADRGADTTAQ
jgi:ketosteroid isomerase-like protein